MDDIEFYGSVQDALLLDHKKIRYVLTDEFGTEHDAFDVHTEHDIDGGIGTCDFTLEASDVIDLGTKIKVQAGYGSAISTIFDGRIPDDEYAVTEDGWFTVYRAVGWSSLLTPPARTDLVYDTGETSLKTIFESLCLMRNVPNYLADNTQDVDGVEIALGGVAELDDGKIIIEKDTSLLDWLKRVCEMFEYYIYDTPSGIVRLGRFIGPPDPVDIVATYEEGAHVISLRKARSSVDIINDWEIRGASYTSEADGSTVAIRTFPLEVPNDPLLPLGYAHGEIQDEILSTLELAEMVRKAKEIRYGVITPLWTWECEGDPERQIGDGVKVISNELAEEADVFITRITQTVSDEGYWAEMSGLAGAGEPNPPGNDCISIPLLTGTIHLGNETLNNYRIKKFQGIEKKIAFTVPDDYSSLTIRGFAHGSNSFVGNTDSTASRFEIHQGSPLEKVSEGELPRQVESLTIPYGTGFDNNWTAITIPLTGSLTEGSAELRILSGFDSDVGDRDDFEVRDLTLTACGVGSPIYPSGG